MLSSMCAALAALDEQLPAALQASALKSPNRVSSIMNRAAAHPGGQAARALGPLAAPGGRRLAAAGCRLAAPLSGAGGERQQASQLLLENAGWQAGARHSACTVLQLLVAQPMMLCPMTGMLCCPVSSRPAD